jgi:hypothetical protein
MLFLVLSAQAQTDAKLEPIGGPGGGQFVARCPQGQFLTGVDLRYGDDVDSIKIICVVAYGAAEVSPPVAGGEVFGGSGGGQVEKLVCPKENPVVTGMYVNAWGVDTLVVGSIGLYCGAVATTQVQRKQYDVLHSGVRTGGASATSREPMRAKGSQRCPTSLVAVGINGRSGVWLDAVGLICGVPSLTPKPAALQPPVKAVGRIKLPPADLDALAARGAAIANDDPLTAQLRNLQAEGPARRGFDIGIAAAEGQTEMGPGKQKIHDYLSPAEREGFTTAVSFSLARNKQRIAELEPRGAVIVNRDPLAVLLRNQQPAGAARQGFDIGMAAAEGQTENGPGKQRIHDSLSPAEQGGFAIAVAFSLERNRNAGLAAKGAAIAGKDPALAKARNAQEDAFYRLGFDIATGLFDDRTAGLGSLLKVRDSLSPAVKKGFDVSVELHSSRK